MYSNAGFCRSCHVRPCCFHTKGGSFVHGTAFPSKFAALAAQVPRCGSCILLPFRAVVRYFYFPLCGRLSGFSDAQRPERACVDRWPALREPVTFSILRFRGFCFPSGAAVFGELRGRSGVWLYCPGRDAVLWLRRMAGEMASLLQRKCFRAGSLPLLAAESAIRRFQRSGNRRDVQPAFADRKR